MAAFQPCSTSRQGRTAFRRAQIGTGAADIITAHRFIELGKFEALEAELKSAAKLIYLEDVREGLSALDKGAAAIGSFLPQIIVAQPSPDKPAVIHVRHGRRA